MLDVGILGSDDPYELIDGVLERKVTQNPPHAEIVRRLTASLVRTLTAGPEGRLALPGIDATLDLGGAVSALTRTDEAGAVSPMSSRGRVSWGSHARGPSL